MALTKYSLSVKGEMGLTFGAAFKMPLGVASAYNVHKTIIAILECMGSSPGSASHSSFLLTCTVQGNR